MRFGYAWSETRVKDLSSETTLMTQTCDDNLDWFSRLGHFHHPSIHVSSLNRVARPYSPVRGVPNVQVGWCKGEAPAAFSLVWALETSFIPPNLILRILTDREWVVKSQQQQEHPQDNL